jgi:transcriptional repressor NrdR
MRCPKCSHTEDKVIDSRSVASGAAIRRRRACLQCGYRFTTYEEVVRAQLKVTKRDGRSEPLDKQKLTAGVARACEKRPVSAEEIEAMVVGIIDELAGEYERDVPSQAIGEKVMERLERLDEVAYVRFASVYRRFKDVNQFVSAIQGLIGKSE